MQNLKLANFEINLLKNSSELKRIFLVGIKGTDLICGKLNCKRSVGKNKSKCCQYIISTESSDTSVQCEAKENYEVLRCFVREICGLKYSILSTQGTLNDLTNFWIGVQPDLAPTYTIAALPVSYKQINSILSYDQEDRKAGIESYWIEAAKKFNNYPIVSVLENGSEISMDNKVYTVKWVCNK